MAAGRDADPEGSGAPTARSLAFATIEPRVRELRLLHRWLDSWRGIGDIVAGMGRQGYDLRSRSTTSG